MCSLKKTELKNTKGGGVFITPPSDYILVIDKTFDVDHVQNENGIYDVDIEKDASLDKEFEEWEVYSVGPLVKGIKTGDIITTHRTASFRTLKTKTFPLVGNKLLNENGVHLLRLNIVDVRFVESHEETN